MTTLHHTATKSETNPMKSASLKMLRMPAMALFCAVCILLVSSTCAADELTQTQSSESNLGEVSTPVQRAERAMDAGDYETAFAEYRAALDEANAQPGSASLRQNALDGFTKAGIRLVEQRIAEAQWPDAEDKIRTILQPEYNPSDKTAQKLLQQLENPLYYNKTITPEFVQQVEEVKHRVASGEGLIDSGRFNEAKKAFDSVLELDPYNAAAWQGIETINKAKRRVADMARKANAPLMRQRSEISAEWLPLGILGALALFSFALIFKGVFGSTSPNGLQNGGTANSGLFPLGWFVLAVALLAFAVIATRYQVIFVPDQTGQNVLKVDRWTGSVEWLAD